MAHSSPTRRQVLPAAGLAASMLTLPSLFAQSPWPTRAIRFVVPFAPGGTPPDIVKRAGIKAD